MLRRNRVDYLLSHFNGTLGRIDYGHLFPIILEDRLGFGFVSLKPLSVDQRVGLTDAFY
jgi:hypothetical protein